MTKVSIIKCENYDQRNVDKAVEEAVNSIGGIKVFIKKGDKVLIKPNMVIAKRPDMAATTHPHLIKAVIKIAKKVGAHVSVGDSSWKGDINTDVGDKTGIKSICDEMNVKLICLGHGCKHKIKGKKVKSVFISKDLLQFDKIINLPKMKTHILAEYTGAVKNLYGCIPGHIKSYYHSQFPNKTEFSNFLLDLYLFIKPSLNIMDGIIGMEGYGPTNGTPKKAKVVIASGDALALDAVATKIMCLRDVPVIEEGIKRKLKEAHFNNAEVIGEMPFVKFKTAAKSVGANYFFTHTLLRGLFKFSPWPEVNKRKCIGCASCFKVCPGRAITMFNKNPWFDYSKCIKCYCCHEVCPVGAIELRSDYLRSMKYMFSGKK